MPSFGRYEIEGKLGEGAMGVVWRARDPILGRTVALKALTADLGEGDEVHQRFRREAEAMGRLSHPRIVKVFDLGEAEGQLYMAMEVLEGEDLRAVIVRRFEVPLVERVRLMLEISEGVAYAHSRGVVHRDLKPANLFVTADGSVKILDFGLARLTAGAAITRRGAIVGTPDYMSPEQAAGRPLDHRSDEFSLGAVFYELLTFEKPFPGRTLHSVLYQIISGEEEPILSQAPEVPARVAALVHSLLRKDPDRRPPDMDAVTRELREIHASLRRSGSRSALPLPRALAVAPPSEEARTRVGERLARARGMSSGARETIDELRSILAVDPDCGEATELLWASLRSAWGAAPTETGDPALEARIDSLLARARPGAPAQQIHQALAELVLLAPDDPRVHDLCRPKPS